MAMFHTNVLDNQIKALPTIKAISNTPIATFTTDIADRLVNLQVAVTATGGGGTPSTPISINGFSQANILVASKNLFNKATVVNNKWFSDNGSIISLNGRFYSALIPVEPNTDYYLTNVVGAGSFISTVHFESDRTTIIGAKNILGSNTQSGYITTFSNSAFMLINGFLSDIDTVQVVKGNTATAYEQPTTHTINFGQTVYGGSLDVITGKLTITHGYVDLGTLTWQSTSQNRWLSSNVSSLIKPPVSSGTKFNGICSIYDIKTADEVYLQNEGISCGTNGVVLIYDSALIGKTATEVQGYLNGAQLVYELATPTTIQLSSEEVTTIANSVNNIYADTGDIIDLKYVLSVGKAII